MRRWLYAYRYVGGDPNRLERTLLRDAPALLRAATGGVEASTDADGSFPLNIGAHVAGMDLAKRVRVQVGVAYRSADRVLLPVSWRADPGRLVFPAFEGRFELEPLDASTAQLAIAGRYRTPLGVLGGLVDAALLHRIASDTARRLVRAVGRELATAVAEPIHEPPPRARHGEPLRVADVMTPDPLVIDAEMPLRTAALMLFHGEISGAPVATAAGELVGVLSERDLLAKEATVRFGLGRRAAAEDRRRAARTAGEACTRPALVTSSDALLSEVARDMLDRDVSRLVVVDGGRLAGIVSRHDVLAALLRDDADVEHAVQRILDAHAADDVQACVQWGEVTLAGRVRLRSTAEQLPVLAAAVDGVMVVDADDLDWEENDVMPPVPYT